MKNKVECAYCGAICELAKWETDAPYRNSPSRHLQHDCWKCSKRFWIVWKYGKFIRTDK